MKKARLIYDCPETNNDLFYATRFLAPDPVLYLDTGGKKYLLLTELEYGRGKRTAKVDAVYPYKKYSGKTTADTIANFCREKKVGRLQVPRGTAFTLADGLRKRGFKVEPGEAPFCPQRTIKTLAEKKQILSSQKITFRAIGLAEKILRESVVRKKMLHWRGKILTSERLRLEMDHFLLDHGFKTSTETIIAGGDQACDPHHCGDGPLRPHEAIIVDCFPRSMETLMYGDATRTFCKGKASPQLKKQYAAVKQAQALGLQMTRAGINGRSVFDAIHSLFQKLGFETKVVGGEMQGFFHGVGHGIGLDLHEEPVRVGKTDFQLKKGHVVTIEPGLYYRGVGGVRIEDIVYVTDKGCKVLGSYPKRLEII